MLEEIAGLGFERVELSHGVPYSLWPGVLQAVAEKTVKVASLHNFCPLPPDVTKADPNCYEFTGSRSARTSALRYTEATIHNAANLGARLVVVHLGSTGQKPLTRVLEKELASGGLGSRRFVKTKLAALREHERRWALLRPLLEEALDRLVPVARKHGVRLGFEIRERIEEIPLEEEFDCLLDRYGDTVGYWHDFGHAARKAALDWIDHTAQLRRMAPRLLGCHVHDFDYPDHDHRLPGAGMLDFSQLWRAMAVARDPLYVFELSPRTSAEDVKGLHSWWKQNGPGA